MSSTAASFFQFRSHCSLRCSYYESVSNGVGYFIFIFVTVCSAYGPWAGGFVSREIIPWVWLRRLSGGNGFGLDGFLHSGVAVGRGRSRPRPLGSAFRSLAGLIDGAKWDISFLFLCCNIMTGLGLRGEQMDVWDDRSQQDDNDDQEDGASAGSKNWESWRRQVDFSIYVPLMEGIVGRCEVQRCKVASLTIRMRIVCIYPSSSCS